MKNYKISILTTPKFISIIFSLIFILFTNNITIAQTDLKPNVEKTAIDKVFEDWDNPNRPGIAVGVISNGKVVFKKGYGSANLEHNIPITTSTKFYGGIWSMQFTTFAILLLESEGKLSLHDDIRKYIPEVPNLGEKITLHHLLSHTSGLDNYMALKSLAGWNPNDAFTKEHAFSFLKKQKKLNNTPGTEYAFSETGFMLLEEVIAKVSGKPYPVFAKENIFDPLKMDNTTFTENQGSIISNKAQGYIPVGDGFRNVTLNHSEVGPSNVFTTIDDILLWMQNFRNPKIGNASILKKMDTPATLKGKLVEAKNAALYLGQHRYWNFKGAKKLYIIGDGKGYACKIIRFPDQDLMAVVMGNGGRYNGYMTSHIADLFLEKYYNAPATNDSEEAVASIKLSPQQLEKATGTFWNNERFFTTKIILENDTLRYQEIDFNWATTLTPVSKNSFRLDQGGDLLEIVDGGKTLRLTFQNGTVLNSSSYQSDAKWSEDLSAFTGTYFSEKLGTSYTFKIEDGKLIASHSRLTDIQLQPVLKDMFKGNNNDFKEIIFERDRQNGINGFKLNNRKVKGIWFKKVSTGMEN